MWDLEVSSSLEIFSAVRDLARQWCLCLCFPLESLELPPWMGHTWSREVFQSFSEQSSFSACHNHHYYFSSPWTDGKLVGLLSKCWLLPVLLPESGREGPQDVSIGRRCNYCQTSLGRSMLPGRWCALNWGSQQVCSAPSPRKLFEMDTTRGRR